MTLEEYFGDWLKVIDKQELLKVVNKVNALYKIQSCEPAYNNIFKAFNITPYNDLKLVSLAMDPYPQKGVSTGICFANKKDVVKLSPSLEILKEAIIDFEVPHNLINFDPTFEEVSKQGVLLLNSALTVETNKPNSHTYVWRPFISSLLKNLSLYSPGIVYILWGNVAKSFDAFISKNNIVYKMPHPAYYARTNTKIPHSFFVELNDTIYHHFGKRIEWFKEEKNYE
jgi:uracil-DNA glycosylase